MPVFEHRALFLSMNLQCASLSETFCLEIFYLTFSKAEILSVVLQHTDLHMRTSPDIAEESPVHWFQCIKSSCRICSFDFRGLKCSLKVESFFLKMFPVPRVCFSKFALFPRRHKSVSSSLIYCKSIYLQYKFVRDLLFHAVQREAESFLDAPRNALCWCG